MLKEDFLEVDPLSGVLLCWQWGGKEWIKQLAKGCGADNGAGLGRVQSSPWVEEIGAGSWLVPGGHSAALELRITPQELSPGAVQEAQVGSPTLPSPVLQQNNSSADKKCHIPP